MNNFLSIFIVSILYISIFWYIFGCRKNTQIGGSQYAGFKAKPINIFMRIHFQYHPGKATQVVAHFLSQLGGEVDKVKLIKLVYLADRESFLKLGAPLTGDRQVAMRHGPVPSATLNLINGDYWHQDDDEDSFFSVQNHKVKLDADPGHALLDEHELNVLNEILAEHGNKHKWALRDETHTYPEYKEVYVEDTSTTIPYEIMLKHYADESGYRKNRAVINQKMTESLQCPFESSDADL